MQPGKRWERGGRQRSERSLLRYLIVGEDSKSSLDYFKSFKISRDYAEIASIGGAGNTVSVVERAIELKQQAEYEHRPFVHAWCVFDRDEHPIERYRRAFALAKQHEDITVVWANECFELWYLLHFQFRHTGIKRQEIYKTLSKPECLNCKYDKADDAFFASLEERRPIARDNALRLAKVNSHPEQNPSTNVHHLVDQLVRLRDAAVRA